MRRTLRVLCPAVGPESLVGDWGYGSNYYSISKDMNGRILYKEDYPEAVGQRCGATGVVTRAAVDEDTAGRLAAAGINPQCRSDLNEQAGTIWFEKDGDVIKSLFVFPGAPLEHGMKQVAVAITPHEKRLKRGEDEREKRLNTRKSMLQKNMGVLAEVNRYTVYIAAFMVFNVCLLSLPFDNE